ncbi:MAG: aldolase/citrate lyase family protein [Chloroflexota bacterium]|nr:aldolase/citrate lyase family protein [Chloroflexota bacterium]
MRPNKVKALWKQGKPALCFWLSSGDPYIAEVFAHAGADAVVIDMQHGIAITPERAVECLRAISTTDTVPIVRVPWNDPAYIQYVLDAGAYGVIVPLVNTYEEAVKAGGACRYPPLGYRSVGPNRAVLYGGRDYFQHANEEIICLVMIEDIRAIPRLEEMVKAPGIDGFYIGPSDLAVSMGLGPGSDHADPRHQEACRRVLEVARAHGKVAGRHAYTEGEVARYIQQGFLFCPVGSDVRFIETGATAALKALAGLRGVPAKA